jgi:tetratricopeptide (TPR) repeat protein
MQDNELVQARWNRLRAAHKADLPALTVAQARQFVIQSPDCGPAWKILGSALIDLARHADAETALKRALSLCPPDKFWIPLSEMGHLYKARGEYKTAAAWYRQAIEAVPDEASGYIYLGGVLAKSGLLKEAEAAHRAAVRCEQGCRDEAYLNLGLVLRAQERYEEAAKCFELALGLDSKYTAARRALRDVRNTIRFLSAARTKQTNSMSSRKKGGASTPPQAVPALAPSS